jgi:hypothetical protein
MPRYNVDIEKMLEGEYWTNRYVVQNADLAAAVVSANMIYEYERAIHTNIVLFTKYRASDQVPGTDVYQVVTLNTMGLATLTTDYWPLFNVVRCDFNPEGGGRPSRKYLRLPIAEGNITTKGQLSTAWRDALKTAYVDPLVAMVAFVDVDDQALTSGSVYPFVSMRQLRRGSKRKLNPVLP